jgi:hypothetical protein
MALQVCEYPKCKAVTILPFCDEHTDVDDEDVEEIEAVTEPEPRRPTEEDLVSSVMNVVRNHSAVQKKEKPMARCSKGLCPEEAAEDSVRCPKHRDMQRLSNAKSQGRALPEDGKTTRTYTKRPSTQLVTTPAPLPAKRAHAPIVLAEPTIVNPPTNGHNVALPAIYDLITQLEADLATLRGAKDILERHA